MGSYLLLRPNLFAMVTKFKQHAQKLRTVVSIAMDAMQNYNHWFHVIW